MASIAEIMQGFAQGVNSYGQNDPYFMVRQSQRMGEPINLAQAQQMLSQRQEQQQQAALQQALPQIAGSIDYTDPNKALAQLVSMGIDQSLAIAMVKNAMEQQKSQAQTQMMQGVMGDSGGGATLDKLKQLPDEKLRILANMDSPLAPAAKAILDQKEADLKVANQEGLKDDRALIREERKQLTLDKDVQNFAKRLDDSGMNDLMSSVQMFNNQVAGLKDLPGYGQTYGLPDFMVSEEGKGLRQTVAAIRNNILKARSGGAVTPQEAERFLSELGEGYLKGDTQLLRGVGNLETTLKQKVQNIRAGFGDDVVSEYTKRGGKLLGEPNATDLDAQALQMGVSQDELMEYKRMKGLK
jgi:hypothetical protein